jgi:hypothetical protein
MAVAYRQDVIGTVSSGSTSAAVNLTGFTAGDLCFVAITRAAAIDPTTVPSGWNLVVARFGTTYATWLYYKVLVSGDLTTVTWSWASSAKTAADAFSVYGQALKSGNPAVATSTPFDSTGAGGTIGFGSLACGNPFVIGYARGYSTSTRTATIASSYVEQHDTYNSSPDFHRYVANRTDASGTLDPTITIDSSLTETYRAGVQFTIGKAEALTGTVAGTSSVSTTGLAIPTTHQLSGTVAGQSSVSGAVTQAHLLRGGDGDALVYAQHDTHINTTSPTYNFDGSNSLLNVGDIQSVTEEVSRALLIFDLTGQPTLGRAVLSLKGYAYNNLSETTVNVEAYRVLQWWCYECVAWNFRETGPYLYWDSVGASTPDVDRAESPSGTGSWPTSETRAGIELTSLVRAWQGGADNYGVLLKLSDADEHPGTSPYRAFRFRPVDYLTEASRPYLIVDYASRIIAGVSTVTGVLNVEHPLSGTVAGTSSVTGVLTHGAGLTGTVAGLATVAGSLAQSHTIASSISATSSVAGAIVRDVCLLYQYGETFLGSAYDQSIISHDPDTPKELTSDKLAIGDAETGWDTCSRGLVRFDLTGQPAIRKAFLSIVAYAGDSGHPETGYYLEFWRLLVSWTDGQATWNSSATGTAWTTPGTGAGTDRAAAASVSQLVADTGYNPYTIDVTSDVVAWQAGSNHGWLLKLNTAYEYPGVSQYRYVRVYTKEAASAGNCPRLGLVFATSAIIGASSVSGAPVVDKVLSGTVAGTSSVTGVLDHVHVGGWECVGTVAGVSSVSGAVGQGHALEAAVYSWSHINGGELVRSIILTGGISGEGTIAGTFGMLYSLAHTISGVSSVSTAVDVLHRLVGAVVVTSTVVVTSGEPHVERCLVGLVAGHGMVTVSVIVQLHALTGEVAAAAAATASMQLLKSADSPHPTATLTPQRVAAATGYAAGAADGASPNIPGRASRAAGTITRQDASSNVPARIERTVGSGIE